MCYAIPAKLVEIDGRYGIVDYFGERRKILLDEDEVAIGDYLFAQGGVFVKKIPDEEAEEILDTWKDIFFELKKVDQSLSKIDKDKVSENVLAVLQKVNHRKSLKLEELKTLFSMKDPKELSVLYEVANHVRERSHGNACCVHGIIEFSNYCNNNCHYCGIRKDRDIPRFRMSEDEIVAIAKEAVDVHGFKALVLQSGEDFHFDTDALIRIVTRVRALGTLVFVSVGMRSRETYEKLWKAGARGVLMRFESSNEECFNTLRPGTSFRARIALLEELRKMGYVIATGFILGLPGETLDDVINNILLTKQLGPDMYSFGPLIPTKGTPLENEKMPTVEDVLKVTAVARLNDANANILVTTALETMSKEARKEGMMAGANSMMINLTPSGCKAMYSIYDDRAGVEDEVSSAIGEAVDLLTSLGRAPTDIGIARGV